MTQAVYMMAQIDVRDHKAYMEEYGVPVLNQFIEAGAEVLVASADAEVFEGSWPGNWTVVVKFSSAEAATNWYNSIEYAPLKAARIEQLSNGGSVAMVPGFDAVGS
jgi:uncharacterized protein (DUF1330 family)